MARHHPNVRVPPRLEEKPKEEQIRRCADRIKSHPSAVDTLYRALSTIINNPMDRKYRRIDQSNTGYQRSLAKVPGAEQMLLALGFTQVNSKTLFLGKVNRDLLHVALSILEQTKESAEYQQVKKEQLFAREVTTKVRAAPNEQEQVKRQELLSMLPKEPAPGRCAILMIQLGDHDSTTLTRRFDGDDTLQDVLHWLGGTAGTVFLDKLYTSREWSMVDVNRQGSVPLDCSVNSQNTLQHLGFWPSGRLALRPSAAEWMMGASVNVEMGASRGLGSAPSDMY